MSARLLDAINASYARGLGGYNEVAVPTIASQAGLSLASGAEECMLYTYRNTAAPEWYDGFRNRSRRARDDNFVDAGPCLLHPVKPRGQQKQQQQQQKLSSKASPRSAARPV
jgi:hypothetical protein